MFQNTIISIFISIPLLASSVVVNTINPIKKSIDMTINVTGKVESKNSTYITAKTVGILKMKVTNDSFVNKGDSIAFISNIPRDKKIALLKSRLALQKSQLQFQQNKIKTAKDKYKMGVGSKNNYLSEKIALKQLQEQYNIIQNRYETLMLEEKNSTVYAPQSGVVTKLLADNSYINYGSKIATLVNENNFIKLFVYSFYAKEIKKGMKVKILSSYKNCDAQIVNVLPKSSNNLIEVIAQSKEKLPLNLLIDAKIILKKFDGILIPKSSIVLVQNHPAIYLIDEKDIAHIFFIEIQKDMIQNALIKNTLPKNAKIALKNAYMLHDNLEVSVK